jgi:3-oxoacyl-[acyl-carrier protein] reductase
MGKQAKVVVITGATFGIGEAIADMLANSRTRTLKQPMFKVYNLDKQLPPSDDLPTDIMHIECDIRNRVDVIAACDFIIKDGNDKVDILINNAGYNYLNWFEKISWDSYDHVMDTNVKGTFFVTQRFLPLLKASRGTVLNIISNAATKPMTCSSIYNASKGAQAILTRQLARELTPKYGITVFGVSPNKIPETKMSDYVDHIVPELRGWSSSQAIDYELVNIPCRANTDKNIFAQFIVYLLSDKRRNQYLSGNILEYGV